jgi:predicted metal-dependent hydrolase
MKSLVPDLITRWQPVIGVRVADWGIKKMKTRWGSCNVRDQRVWLNLELAKKPPHCLEYVLVHEMVHLLERHHNERFKALMDQFMPQWRLYRDKLNQAPLAHEEWAY